MSKHTQGPWFSEGATVYALVSDGFKRGVEQFRNSFWCLVQGVGRSDEELEANARLIAAAPELLEALEGIIGAYEKLDGHVVCRGSWHSHAVAAISKAKGEA